MKKNPGIKEIVFREELSCIDIETRSEAPTGTILEQKRIMIKGPTLQECKKIYDKVKNDNH